MTKTYIELTNDVLNEFKFLLQDIAKREGKRLQDLIPSHLQWVISECEFVMKKNHWKKEK